MTGAFEHRFPCCPETILKVSTCVFFFFFFFLLRRILVTLATDVTRRPVAIYVLCCVCDSASSSERERTASESGTGILSSFHTTVLGQSVEQVEPPPKVASTCTFQSCFVLLMHTITSMYSLRRLGYDDYLARKKTRLDGM